MKDQILQPIAMVWSEDELARLRDAQASLFDAVIRMVCADPLRQTAEERNAVVGYIKAMAVAVRNETH